MKINFLFFPFTHITQYQLKTVLAFFPSIKFLPICSDLKSNQTLYELQNLGKIFPIFSSPNEIERINQKTDQYLAWAKIHKGNETNLKLLLKDNPYFTSDTNVTAIKTQIKSVEETAKQSLETESDSLQDLLFLKMAHLCDAQNEQIDLKLKDLDNSRDKLVSTLRGLESPLDESKDGQIKDHRESDVMMIRERIMAWSKYMTQNEGFKNNGGNPLFITTSESVFNYIESNCKDVVNALDIDKIKVHENDCENKKLWQQAFADMVICAAAGDEIPKADYPIVNDTCSLTGQCKLNFFSGNEINRHFNLSDNQVVVCLVRLK
mgnify:CR=1 FL=1